MGVISELLTLHYSEAASKALADKSAVSCSLQLDDVPTMYPTKAALSGCHAGCACWKVWCTEVLPMPNLHQHCHSGPCKPLRALTNHPKQLEVCCLAFEGPMRASRFWQPQRKGMEYSETSLSFIAAQLAASGLHLQGPSCCSVVLRLRPRGALTGALSQADELGRSEI